MDAQTILNDLQTLIETKTAINNERTRLAELAGNMAEQLATFQADFTAWMNEEAARVKKGAAPNHAANGQIIAALAKAFQEIFPLLMQIFAFWKPTT
jgi:hypothetical protein